MSIKLEDYEEFPSDVPAVRDVLEGRFHEAAHIMSPMGLETYMLQALYRASHTAQCQTRLIMSAQQTTGYQGWRCTMPLRHTWLRICAIQKHLYRRGSSARHRCSLST